VARHRTRLHQQLRELRASARRGVVVRARRSAGDAAALSRGARAVVTARARREARLAADAAALGRVAGLERRRRDLERWSALMEAHDVQRTLERGYALVEDVAGDPVTSAAAARDALSLTLRMHDGRVPVRPEPPIP
jgi:exodeoxyribonuclease VII large subunit